MVVGQGNLNDGTTTLEGLFNNYTLVGVISISGFIPVTFTLLTLHSIKTYSWYLLILSICTVGLSNFTLLSIGDFHVSAADLQNLKNTTSSAYPACGSKSPATFCLQSNGFFYLQGNDAPTLTTMTVGFFSIGASSLIFSDVILLCILIQYCGLQRTLVYRKVVTRITAVMMKAITLCLKASHDSPVKLRLTVHQSRWATQRIFEVLEDFIYFIIWSIYVFSGLVQMLTMTSLSNGATLSPVMTWTFGQIVAITVFAGPLFEFLKLSCR